ncbi:hypothetical protein [Hymenobacter guriensis]|uniref:Uncharacterized protein n=1 Tax=Hymenobacter guriensis TaxID=2793065 RepID=A0ABS0L6L8_9BACT|nr:hypothetical protein [Hymenobacter guriensis]MBG8555002.1 hypothetical protein [Hymenobacter guriensis]
MSLREQVERQYTWSEFRAWEEWQQGGRQIFDFSAGLLEMLELTDASQVGVERLRLPYPRLYMDLSAAGLHLAGADSPRIEGVYLLEDTTDLVPGGKLQDRMIHLEFTGEYMPHFAHVNEHLIELAGRGFHTYTLLQDVDERGAEPLVLPTTIGKVVADATRTFATFLVEGTDEQTQAKIIDLHSTFLARTVNLIVNCLLYLMYPEREVKRAFSPGLPGHLATRLAKATTRRRRQVAEADLATAGYTRVTFVGSNIPTRAERTAGLPGAVAPHWRRGHWRRQRLGPSLQEEKLLWIQPTLVNQREGEPVKGRVYGV